MTEPGNKPATIVLKPNRVPTELPGHGWSTGHMAGLKYEQLMQMSEGVYD